MRKLTTQTRLRIEKLISRLRTGDQITLEERIKLKKYSTYIPFIAGKLNRAINDRVDLNK